MGGENGKHKLLYLKFIVLTSLYISNLELHCLFPRPNNLFVPRRKNACFFFRSGHFSILPETNPREFRYVVSCTGSESSYSQCTVYSYSNCGHKGDVYVSCSGMKYAHV